MKKIIVAVDGTAGSGKSSTFKYIAKKINYNFIDTGLMYRAFTLHTINENTDFNNKEEIISKLKTFHYDVIDNEVFLNNKNITNELEKNYIVEKINFITPIKLIRDYMVNLQRTMVKNGGVIMIGRDITSVVLPNADLKIYLDSSVESRAKRRFDQNIKNNITDKTYDQIKESMIIRDFSDKNREIGALKVVPDAMYIDNSNLTIIETAEIVINKIKQLENEV